MNDDDFIDRLVTACIASVIVAVGSYLWGLDTRHAVGLWIWLFGGSLLVNR